MRIHFSIIKRKHKSISISNSRHQWIIRFWSRFPFYDIVKFSNTNQ